MIKKLFILLMLLCAMPLFGARSINSLSSNMNMFMFTTNIYSNIGWTDTYNNQTEFTVTNQNGKVKKDKKDKYLKDFLYYYFDITIPWANRTADINRIIVIIQDTNTKADTYPNSDTPNTKKTTSQTNFVWLDEGMPDNLSMNIAEEWNSDNSELHYKVAFRAKVKKKKNISTMPDRIVFILQTIVKKGDLY